MHVDNRHVPTPIYPAKHCNVPPPNMGNTCAQNNDMKFLHQ